MCTENELTGASQLAYLGCLKRSQTSLKLDGRKGPYSIRELIMESFNTDVARKLAVGAGIPEDKITLQDLVKYSDLDDSDKSIIKNLSLNEMGWKIIDIHDTRDVNGFYACCIEKSDRNAIVAFRGSESMKKFSNVVNDWLRADFGLLNSRSTRQQEEAENYGTEISRKGLLDQYEEVAVVGHSLGGNLATHFTISTATEEKKELFNKITQSVNLDGPGVSDEYIKEHRERIEKAAPKLTHLKWSAVGDLLFDIPGENSEFLAINEELHQNNPIERMKYKAITRHRTTSLVFDEDGKAKRGKQDMVSKGLSVISKSVDKIIPEWLTTELYAAADWVFESILRVKDKINDVHMEFAKVSWLERFKKRGSVLATCADFINSAIEVFKEGTLCLGEGMSEIFFGGDNIACRKVALADVYGSVDSDLNFNLGLLNQTIPNLNPRKGKQEREM